MLSDYACRVRRWTIGLTASAVWLVALPGVSAHPGHEDGVHVEPIYTLLLLAGVCLLGGSFLLLTRDDTERSPWGLAAALVGVALLVVGATGWL